MNDIWSIIGLSSLIASVVTIVLGIVRDVFVERYRFKREKEAGYLQGQIRLYSRIHFLIRRLTIGAVTSLLFEGVPEALKECNKTIEESSDLLEPRFLNEWLSIMTLIERATKAKKEQKTKSYLEADKNMRQIISIIEEVMNNNLIPKYRKIVGETVPRLE